MWLKRCPYAPMTRAGTGFDWDAEWEREERLLMPSIIAAFRVEAGRTGSQNGVLVQGENVYKRSKA